MIRVILAHAGGGSKVCDDAYLSANGKRVSVHFAHGHWREFLIDSGLLVGRRKADLLDDGKGRLSTWRLSKEDLQRFRAEAAKLKRKKAAGSNAS